MGSELQAGKYLADGQSASAPSYSFGHTTATGMYSPGANQIRFSTASADRLTIASTGLATFNAGITVSSGDITSGRILVDKDGDYGMEMQGASATRLRFYTSDGGTGSTVGTVTVSTTATQYNTSSDYRLKENLEPLTGALDRIDQLPVYRFNFTADPDTTVDGFVAHEVQAHVPEAVTGEKDAMKTVEIPAVLDDDGNEVEAARTEEQPDYQGIDQSKLVPLLVAAVKELKAKVEALEGGE